MWACIHKVAYNPFIKSQLAWRKLTPSNSTVWIQGYLAHKKPFGQAGLVGMERARVDAGKAYLAVGTGLWYGFNPTANCQLRRLSVN